MKCGREDPNEICLADQCMCCCHDEFWAGVDKWYEENKDKEINIEF